MPEGWITGPPDFVGVGVARAGTTRWYRLICKHPQVQVSPKERHFFTNAPFEQPGDYAAMFPRPEGKIIGEWTPSYALHPWVMPMLAEQAPQAKILMLTREPSELYRSAMARYEYRSGKRDVLPLHAFEALAYCDFDAQIERIRAHFPAEQILVQRFEDTLTDSAAELARAWEFLGLESVDLPAATLRKRHNHVPSGSQTPDWLPVP